MVTNWVVTVSTLGVAETEIGLNCSLYQITDPTWLSSKKAIHQNWFGKVSPVDATTVVLITFDHFVEVEGDWVAQLCKTFTQIWREKISFCSNVEIF